MWSILPFFVLGASGTSWPAPQDFGSIQELSIDGEAPQEAEPQVSASAVPS